MLYLCGSDLESRNGMATYNLNEIAQSALSINSGSNVLMFESNAGDKAVSGLPGDDGSPQDMPDRVDDLLLNKGQVNLVLETGGCKEWHASEKPGIDISAEKLQRYSYDPAWVYHHSQPFTLENEQELSSMADKETLTDFIRWSAASFPAEKYALILWDHGGGSKTGIFVDELFDGDVLHLNELDEALAESGIHFEVIAMDACMMANLETAVALKDHANYMIGSEEMVSGNGSAYSEWLNELYIHPDCDGIQFGRCFCNMTQSKYANIEQSQFSNLLTLSVIDLSKIDKVAELFDQLFAIIGEEYRNSSDMIMSIYQIINAAEMYGLGKEHMIDLAGIFYSKPMTASVPLSFRNEMIDALEEAVVYTVKGRGRSGAHGLSFCYAADFSDEELSVYALNCKSPHYLAYLDMLDSTWDAPSWIYDEVDPLPKLEYGNQYSPLFYLQEYGGLPCVQFVEEENLGIGDIVSYRFYRKDEMTGTISCLGSDYCYMEILGDDDSMCVYFLPYRPDRWLSIDGELICMELVEGSQYKTNRIYNIPIQLDGRTYYLRMGLAVNDMGQDMELEIPEDPERMLASLPENRGEYTIYGIWEGYYENSSIPGRNAITLSNFAGREYQFQYPVFDESGSSLYDISDYHTITRAMDVEYQMIPAGTYYIEYVMKDVFGRTYTFPLQELYWDGENFTLIDKSMLAY